MINICGVKEIAYTSAGIIFSEKIDKTLKILANFIPLILRKRPHEVVGRGEVIGIIRTSPHSGLC